MTDSRHQDLLYSLLYSLICILFCLNSGCSPTVQEDRTIEYSAEGGVVAFQHGNDGVYVASSDGSKLQKVLDTADALAVSAPLFSGVDGQLIFTTAQTLITDESPNRSLVEDWDADPRGRRFHKLPIEYTCWLRSADHENQSNEPVKLFSARLDHPGYVAANLAVRWHPSGNRILYLDQVGDAQVSLFEFHLRTQRRRRLLDKQASAMIFDWSSNAHFLTCSLLGVQGDSTKDGLWMIDQSELEDSDGGELSSFNWRRVDDSNWASVPPDSQSLGHLRQTRPAWTTDDEQFAFLSLDATSSDRVTHRIYVVQAATGAGKLLHQTESLVRDLRWQPHSQRLAFIEGGEIGNLRFIDLDGTVTPPANEFPVRSFAGWNFDGSRLAYVSPEPIADPKDQWAFLFLPVPAARDRVFVADGIDGRNAEMVHDQVRITFPHWSPTQTEMSLWGTYAPTHRSLLSYGLPWTLRPGDPAATLDLSTGTMRWMAVNRHELSQVGHYFLMKRDYIEAWKWYEKAAEGREASSQLKVDELIEMAMQRRIYHEPTFFEYYCLWKLGRNEEAAERFSRYKETMSLQLDGSSQELIDRWGLDEQNQAGLNDAVAFANLLIQASYMTEVFLSLGVISDGLKIFNEHAAKGETEEERFARLICQSQLLLASHRYQDYAVMAREELAPLATCMGSLAEGASRFDGQNPDQFVASIKPFVSGFVICFALLPMASDDFVTLLSDEEIRDSITAWGHHRETATSQEHRLAVDLVLRSLIGAGIDRDPDAELQALLSTVEQRLQNNPLLSPDSDSFFSRDLHEIIDDIREFSVSMR